jgi:uncharacterized membrane protein HdeD (DUF308 family)
MNGVFMNIVQISLACLISVFEDMSLASFLIGAVIAIFVIMAIIYCILSLALNQKNGWEHYPPETYEPREWRKNEIGKDT